MICVTKIQRPVCANFGNSGFTFHVAQLSVRSNAPLEQQALLWSFYIEREYLAELLEAGEVDSTDLYDLYNEVALAEAMVLDPKNSFH